MGSPANPHDRFFKEVFSRTAVAEDFVRHYLPAEIVALLRPDTLEIRKDSFVDPELTEHYSDLLYGVQLTSGQPGYVYVLFEHKSYPEPRIALDLLRYLVRIWEQEWKSGHRGPLPVVLPIVLYHGGQPWRIGSDFRALFAAPAELAAYVPDFRYLLTDLTTRSDDEVRGAVVLQVALLLLKYIFRPDLPQRLPDILGLLQELAAQRSGLDYLHTALRYVAGGTTQVGRAELSRTVHQIFPRGDDIMATIADEWVHEGLQKGLQKGRQEGEQTVLRRLLIRRFGPLPAWAETRLTEAKTEQLECWADRVLDAPSLEAVFEDSL